MDPASEHEAPRVLDVPVGIGASGTRTETDSMVAAEISRLIGHEFVSAPNKFAAMASLDAHGGGTPDGGAR